MLRQPDAPLRALEKRLRWLTSRPAPTVLAAVSLQLAAGLGFSMTESHSTVSTCLVVIIFAAVAAAAAQGYWSGIVAMLTGSVIFVLYVDLAVRGSAQVWMFLPLPIGLLATLLTAAVREQVRRRTEELLVQSRSAASEAEQQRAVLDDIIVQTEGFLEGKDLEGTLASVADSAKRIFAADLVVVWQVEGAIGQAVAATLSDRSPFVLDPSSGSPVMHPSVARGVRPTFLQLGDDPQRQYQLDRPLSVLGMRSVLKIPVLSRGAKLVLSVAWRESMPAPTHNELLVAQRFGAQAAIGIQKAQAAESQQEAIDMHARLEAGLLPRVSVGRADVTACLRYLPGEHRLLVGGDFLDVMELPDGRVGVIVGDVADHGASAASLGAVLRAGWRALALAGSAPVAVMETLNRLTLSERDTLEVFATAVCAWIDPVAHTIDICLAGHPPPIAAADEVRLLEGSVCPPLGAADDAEWIVNSIAMDDQWSLVFLTDGIFEARCAPDAEERIGLDGVVRWLARSANGRLVDEQVLDSLVAYAAASNGGRLDDDVTIVAVRGTGPSTQVDAESIEVGTVV